MKKTRLEERMENAVNAFFEPSEDRSHFAMTYTGNDTAFVVDEKPFSEKADKWLRVLREVFMFGPGTFSLFYLTLTQVYFYPTLGIGLYGSLMYFFAIFLTYAGSGNITKVKNLAVPATVIVLGLAFAFLSPLFLGRDLADLYFWDSIYLFPLVIVIAKLVQSWVTDTK